MRAAKHASSAPTTSPLPQPNGPGLALDAACNCSDGRVALDSGRRRARVQAKLGYCKDCHGPSAQGYRGYLPIPRLAGQQPQYLENQLRAFIEHRRTNNIMFNVAHALSPAWSRRLPRAFESSIRRRIGGAPQRLVATGRAIFENGVPDANIAACAACHGPEATGSGKFPALPVSSIPTSSMS